MLNDRSEKKIDASFISIRRLLILLFATLLCYSCAFFVPLVFLFQISRFLNLGFVCKGTACHVRGANRIGDTLQERLGIGHAETTADLKFTAEYVACIGACGMAPVIMVNDATYGSLTVQKMNEVIDKYVSMD